MNAPATASIPAVRRRPVRPGTLTGRALSRFLKIMIKLGRLAATFPSATWEREILGCSQTTTNIYVMLNGAQRSEASHRLYKRDSSLRSE